MTDFSSDSQGLREKVIAPQRIETISSENAKKLYLLGPYFNANSGIVSPQKSPVCGGPGFYLLHQTASSIFESWQEGDVV